MIEAVLHGKLSSKQENMEDVLTSNVFGMLQYVAPDAGVIPFLSRAKTMDGNAPLAYIKDLPAANISVSYRFWPRWSHCEPDVVLDISIADRLSYLIVIEAKHRSGKSSEADDVELRPNDQLAREWLDLSEEADRLLARPLLVFLTADICCPKSEIQDSIDEYSHKRSADARTPLNCWLSWRELPGLFGRLPHLTPLRDIARMAEKLNLTFFQGFEDLSPFHIDWTFDAYDPVWTFEVEQFTCDWAFQF